MTKSQFKDALLRGQGRCIKACQNDPDRYISVVLWACGHEVSFDTQCEGSRAWFVYQLICCYCNKFVFREKVIESLRKAKSDGGWKVLYLAELLYHFVHEGDKSAEQEVWGKYQELYHSLQKRKRVSMKFCYARDDFEQLCVILADNKTNMFKIAEDIGSLYRGKPFIDGWNFEWLYQSKAKKHLKALRKKAETSENVAKFIQMGTADEEKLEVPVVNETPRLLSIRLRRNADKETILKYVSAYLEKEDLVERTEALEVFTRCPYPDDPRPIISDAESEYSQLSEVAWEALENIEHPVVREFAKQKMYTDTEKVLPVFISNYREEDEKELVKVVKSIPVDFNCSTSWHGIHLQLLDMEERGKKVPSDLLYYIVEKTYCSCCREHALQQMGKRKLLTTELLEECLYDSNEDIRKYAKRKIKCRR